MKEENDIELTNVYGGKLFIEISQVECYRGNDGYTSIYLKSGDTCRVLESFEEVDRLLGQGGKQ